MGLKNFLRQKKAGLKRRYRLLTSPSRQLPDFLIIGVQKGGTSSIFYYLDQHPDIEMAQTKELHFFNLFYDRGMRWYRSFFPLKSKNKLTGEATPAYIFHPLAPLRIKEHIPHVKLIILLREPVSRAYSNFQMWKNKKKELAPDFETAIQNEKERMVTDRLEKEKDPNYYSHQMHNSSYLERGFYSRQIKEWQKHFDASQFLFLKSKHFFEDPKSELKKVYDFIGVDAHFPEDLTPQFVNDYAELNPETRASLEAYFSKENSDLKELVGFDFKEK